MKGMDILCTSQAATAIRITTMDEPSSSPAEPSSSPASPSSSPSSISSTTHLITSGRAIDRHNPIIRDEKRVGKSFITPPCSNPQHPISPKPHSTQYHYKKSITIPSSSSSSSSSTGNSMTSKTKKAIMTSSSGIYYKSKSTSTTTEQQQQKRKLGGGGGGRGWGCTKPSAFISPPSSSRYLLSDKALLNVLNDFDPILTLGQQKENSKAALQQAVKRDHHHEFFSAAASTSSASKLIPPPSSSLSRRSPDQQVVVLRVALHCRGCERKMRKHISRMEGVTSFNIDFAAKKLTVVGDVTPLSVLASVSKVKNATLLTPTTISSTPAAPPIPAPDATSNLVAEVDKYREIVV